ncbi:MAG: hypothetical protein HY727_20935 [Candidatus Rokubacteria bacterium]|nr:hypothetical protein [Candidatus Rokubacteria bacterium]
MRRVLPWLAAAALAWPGALEAQAPKHVKVLVEFRGPRAEDRQAVEGSGRVVITEKGSARASGSVRLEGKETRRTQSSGIFTIVPDGGEATLTVATQVPYSQVVFYQDYATGRGYVASGVHFKDVGTSLTVRATVLPDSQVKVRLTPRISYFSAGGSGVIELTEASTELVVASGRPLVIGGATTETHEVTRQILGVSERRATADTTVTLTATIQ